VTASRAAGRQPAGLYTLFFTEMWERFSYYGMRALLVLYLVNALEIPRAQALELYAVYTALVYLTPLAGGYLADRYLGARRAVLVGGLLMALGHFAMAVPALLHLALGLLVAGNGFFKPNISHLVGGLYREGDPRRDGGFTLFYMGINLGAFLSPLVCGTLGERLGWHYGFAAAGVGMVLGLGVFLRGGHRLPGADLGWPDYRLAGAVTAVTAALVAAVVFAWPWVSTWLTGAGAWAAAGLFLLAGVGGAARRERRGPGLTPVERDRLLAILVMAFFVVFFWMGFEQAGGTMNLFADRLTDRRLGGWEVPASYFQAANPLYILLLAPLFSRLWWRLDRGRWRPSVVVKQAAGLLLLGAGFALLLVAQRRAEAQGLVGPQWLLAVYLLHTLGELCLSPIGLSMVTKLAPARWLSLLLGLWFSAMALANYLAGTLEALLAAGGLPLYGFLVASSLAAGLLLLCLAPWLSRRMHGVH